MMSHSLSPVPETRHREARRVIPISAAPKSVVSEAERVLGVCNACRYCEGFCAVFPAMTRRLEFSNADIHYLANLCHNCGACLHACQYAAPHEFDINVPRSLAKVRLQTYTQFAWPQALGSLYSKSSLTLAVALAVGLAVVFQLMLLFNGAPTGKDLGGNFYAVLPHNAMVMLFGATFGFSVIALIIGLTRFWRGITDGHSDSKAGATATTEAAINVLRLKYLDGGHGDGCNEAGTTFSPWRRRFHHMTFYGFMLCFASTAVATLYHYLLDLHAPYPLVSAPVVLGVAGGIGLTVGPIGLLWLNLRRDPQHGDPDQRPMDRGFIVLLLLISVTGLLLLSLRGTSVMPSLLGVHLATVMAFFLTMPYGKFAHGIYRSAALLKHAIERRQPNPATTASD